MYYITELNTWRLHFSFVIFEASLISSFKFVPYFWLLFHLYSIYWLIHLYTYTCTYINLIKASKTHTYFFLLWTLYASRAISPADL